MITTAKPGAARKTAVDAMLDAVSAVLLEKPAATLQEIADGAGIGIATLHRRFSGRDGLMLALARRAVDLMEEALAAASADGEPPDPFGLCAALLPVGDKVAFLLAQGSLWDSEEIELRSRRLDARILAAIEAWKAAGTLRPGIPPTWALQAFYALLFAAWEEVAAGGAGRNAAPELMAETLLYGIAGRAPAEGGR